MRAAKHAELEPPHPGEAIWMAIEDRATVRQALASWREKLRDGADILDGMGGEIIWNHTEKFWANFNGVDDEHRQGHYWNPFGLVPERFRQNMIVEVNPAVSGKNTNVQGVVARDPGGQIWVLHGGRLHPPDHRVRGEEFDKIYKARRVVVQFDDGTTFRYHPVAMVNAAATRLQADTAAFVKACKYIRDYYSQGKDLADQLQKIERAEEKLTPEKGGEYIVGARGEVTARRKHAIIWKALVQVLSGLGVTCANQRVGRFGPDLLTTSGTRSTLFEIKSVQSAAAIYEGFGQLHIYDRLFEKRHRKVLVLPRTPGSPIGDILTTYDVEVLVFEQNGRHVTFDPRTINEFISRRPRN